MTKILFLTFKNFTKDNILFFALLNSITLRMQWPCSELSNMVEYCFYKFISLLSNIFPYIISMNGIQFK